MNDICDILKDLKSDPCFSGFRLLKGEFSLVDNSHKGECQWVVLNGCMTYVQNPGSAKVDYQLVYPIYHKRFSVLSEWYQRFYAIPLYNVSHVRLDGRMLGLPNSFRFPCTSGADLFTTDEYLRFKETVKTGMGLVNDNYATLEKYYAHEIVPILNGRKISLCPNNWMFFDLALARIVSPQDYCKVKLILLEHTHEYFARMGSYYSYDHSMFYSKLEEVLPYLESDEFDDYLHRSDLGPQ